MKFGEFEAHEKIGAGGMGTVWEVTHPRRSDRFAAKVAMHAKATLPEFRQRFEREVRAMCKLRHPNVVRVYDYGVYFDGPAPDAPRNGTPWVVMEYAEGGELDPEWVDSWDKLQLVLRSLLAGLGHSHSRGLIHRDVKPQNILWVTRRGQRVPAVADFGIAHALDRHRPSTVDHFTARNAEEATGTPRYMAPEQFMGLWRDYGPGTDLYATGILAYVLACGKAPYKGQNLFQYAAKHLHSPFPELETRFEVPEHFSEWVKWLTAKDIGDRPASAAEAIAALDEPEPATAVFPVDWASIEPDDEPGRAPVGVGLFGLNRPYLVGRGALRDRLWSALGKASEGKTVALNLHGEAGVGKSRLARWLLELGLENALVGRGYSAHFSADRADTAGLAWMVAQRVGCIGMDSESLDDRLSQVLPEAWNDEVKRAVAQVVSQAESVASDITAPTVKASMIVEVARRFIELDAQDKPVVVHLDDVDTDPTGQGLQLVTELLASNIPAVVVVTSRISVGIGESIEVAPLAEIDFKRLLRDEMGLPIEVSDRVQALAGGNPRFAIQLLDHWLESGALTHDESGELVLRDENVPATLEALWEARVGQLFDRLDDDARPVLVAGGVLGSPIGPEEWLATAAELGVDVESPIFGDVASALVESGLGTWDDSDRLQLTHRTLASLFASAGDDELTRRAHGAAARALTSLYSPTEPGLALRVAHHFTHSGKAQLALIALQPALDAAVDLVDSGEIGVVAQAILDTMDVMGSARHSRNRLRIMAFRSIEWVTSAREDDRERAGEWLDQAEELTAEAGGDTHAQIRSVRAWASIARGGREEAAEALEAIVADESLQDRTRALARVFLTHIYTYLHDGDAVRRHAVVTIQSDVPVAWKLRAREALIHVALAARDPDNAKQHAFPALILAKQLKRLHLEVHIENLSGFIADLDGDFALAEQHHTRAETLASLVQPHAGVRLMAREYRARAMVHQGKFVDAFELLWSLADEVESGRAPGIHPWDALYACAVAIADQPAESRARDRVFPARPNALHVRSVAAALNQLRQAGRAEDAAEVETQAREIFGNAPGVSDGDLETLTE